MEEKVLPPAKVYVYTREKPTGRTYCGTIEIPQYSFSKTEGCNSMRFSIEDAQQEMRQRLTENGVDPDSLNWLPVNHSITYIGE